MKIRSRFHALLATSALSLVIAAVASAQQPSPPPPVPETPPPVAPLLQNYKPVTAERLKQPEDGDWLMYRRTYDSWGYSPLSEITPENATRLKPVWTLQTGQVEGHQAPPTVNNGVMFVATPGNQVLAIDAKAGNLLWRFKRPIPEDILLLHPTSRGVGLLGDKVYFAAADAVLVALDAKTGNELWNAKVEDYTKGYYMSLAPLVADGKVMVGVSGGELGVRGFVAAEEKENRLQHLVALAHRPVLLRLVGEKGRGFLERAVARHLAAGPERQTPNLREHAFLEDRHLGLRAQARARQVLAEHKCVLGFFVTPAGLEPRRAEHRAGRSPGAEHRCAEGHAKRRAGRDGRAGRRAVGAESKSGGVIT